MSQTTNAIVQWSQFPKYFAYGIAHLPSKRILNETYYVDYHFGEQKIYEVQLSHHGVTVLQFWEGAQIATVSEDTLEQALGTLYDGKPYYKYPLHEAWVKAVSKAGNILIRYVYGNEPKTLIYPALEREQIVIPIPVNDPERYNQIQTIASRYPHRLQRHTGILTWNLRSDWSQLNESVELIRIILPIAYVPQFVQEVNTAIIPGKLWRAYADLYTGETTIGASFYKGNPTDAFCSYALVGTK